MTSVGVAENYQETDDLQILQKVVGRRSVYTIDELAKRIEEKKSAKILNFFYAKDLEQAIPLAELEEKGVLKGSPQSITKLQTDAFQNLLNMCLKEKDRSLFYD